MIRVAMISRSNLFSVPGGDTVQINNTARSLAELDVKVDILLCDQAIDYAAYDLLHFFNVIRPADIMVHIDPSDKPFVVSPIFVDYSEYESRGRKGLLGALFGLLSPGQKEYLKIIARRLVNGQKIASPLYLLKGHSNSVKYVLRKARMLLPNSESEYRRLFEAFKVMRPYKVVPNAIDENIFTYNNSAKDNKLVICASRIEGRKNQLNLIRALNNSGFKLIIAGDSAPNHKNYYEQCRKEAAENVTFRGNLPQSELRLLYMNAKVHVLPSWFETTGLSSLEAAAMGCNIVITDKGDAREYFGKHAFYCEPDKPGSIRKAVEEAAEAEKDDVLCRKILSEFTWTRAAEITHEAYQEVLKMIAG